MGGAPNLAALTWALIRMCSYMSQNHPFVVAIGGVKGVGKSSVLLRLSKAYPCIKVRYLSREIEQFSLNAFGHGFASFNQEDRRAVRHEVGLKISKELMSDNGVILMDCHYTDSSEDLSNIIQPQSVVVIVQLFAFADANTDTVLQRRKSDLSRKRILNPLDIDKSRESELNAALRLSAHTGKGFYRLDFSGSHEDNMFEILRMLKMNAIDL